MATFDAPGAGTGYVQATFAVSINEEGAVVGYSIDEKGSYRGFVRSPGGALDTFEAPGAGTGMLQGTWAMSINEAGVIAGYYIDASSTAHGFPLQ
jgi:tRNA A58 N-methylase Trm61